MEGGGKRKVLSKEARRYRKQVHELQDKIKDMQVCVSLDNHAMAVVATRQTHSWWLLLC